MVRTREASAARGVERECVDGCRSGGDTSVGPRRRRFAEELLMDFVVTSHFSVTSTVSIPTSAEADSKAQQAAINNCSPVRRVIKRGRALRRH